MRASLAIRILGAVFGGLSLLTCIVALILHRTNALLIISGGFCILSILFAVIENSLKIWYDEDHFTVKRFFLKPKTYTYDEVQKIIRGANEGYTIIVNGKPLRIDSMMAGKTGFMTNVFVQYIKIHNVDIPERQSKVFKGNIYNPAQVLIFLLLAPIALTGLTAFIMISGAKDLKTPDNLIQTQLYVQHCYEENQRLELITEDGMVGVRLRAISNVESLLRTVDEDKPLCALIEPWKTNAKEGKTTNLWELKGADGEKYVTVEATLKDNTHYYHTLTAVFIGITVLTWLLFLGSIYVLDHAQKHPFLVKLLVKEEYWNF